MRLSEAALRAAGERIRLSRYLSHTVSDEELAEQAVVAYKEALPQRTARRPRPVPPRPAQVRSE